MAFRGDIQGGDQNMGFGGGMAGGMMGGGGQGMAGIDKDKKWRIAFFAGACFVTFAGLLAVLVTMFPLKWAPCTFISEVFLLVFGVIMLVLDAPIGEDVYRQQQHVSGARDTIYRFLLFLTRFTGRGFWYLFLSTMVFVALWDEGYNYFFGIVFSLYLLGLGGAAMFKGVTLSRKLNTVREAIVSSGRGAEQFMSRGQTSLSKPQFKTMVEAVTNQPDLFSDEDLDYIVNSLSFTPYNDGQVSAEEYEYWLRPGPMLLV